MYAKLELLLRFHRQNVFDDDAAKADRHHRALLRLKRTQTFRAMCAQTEARAYKRASDRLLSLYA